MISDTDGRLVPYEGSYTKKEKIVATEDITFSDLGREMWSYLTGKQAVINYAFNDMTVDVPSSTGPDAPSARWRINGTLSISTTDKEQ